MDFTETKREHVTHQNMEGNSKTKAYIMCLYDFGKFPMQNEKEMTKEIIRNTRRKYDRIKHEIVWYVVNFVGGI